MSSDPVLAGVEVPLGEGVREFCERHAISEYLEKAIALAANRFSIVGHPAVRFEEDPEDGEGYLVLEIKVEGDESDCAQSHQNYLYAWANSTDWPEVHLIRLVYDVA